MKRILWFWCYMAFKLYLWLPFEQAGYETRYGRFKLWLLGYAGAYAHSVDYADFREHAFTR